MTARGPCRPRPTSRCRTPFTGGAPLRIARCRRPGSIDSSPAPAGAKADRLWPPNPGRDALPGGGLPIAIGWSRLVTNGSESVNKTEHHALNAVLARASTDWEFRQSLISDPRQALEQAFGLQIPDPFKIRFVERDPDL